LPSIQEGALSNLLPNLVLLRTADGFTIPSILKFGLSNLLLYITLPSIFLTFLSLAGAPSSVS